MRHRSLPILLGLLVGCSSATPTVSPSPSLTPATPTASPSLTSSPAPSSSGPSAPTVGAPGPTFPATPTTCTWSEDPAGAAQIGSEGGASADGLVETAEGFALLAGDHVSLRRGPIWTSETQPRTDATVLGRVGDTLLIGAGVQLRSSGGGVSLDELPLFMRFREGRFVEEQGRGRLDTPPVVPMFVAARADGQAFAAGISGTGLLLMRRTCRVG